MAVRIENPDDHPPYDISGVAGHRRYLNDLEADLDDNWEDWDPERVRRHSEEVRAIRAEYKTLESEHERKNSAGARAWEQEEKRERQDEEKKKKAEQGQRRKGQARKAVRAGAGAARNRRRRNRYLEQTGIPAFGRSTTSLTLQTLGTLVGLSALYLILSPNGSKAYAALAKAVQIGVGAIVNPVDPLAPRGGKSHKQTQAEKLAAADAAGDVPALVPTEDLGLLDDATAAATSGKVRRLRPPSSLHHTQRRRPRRP